ncbi:gamma-glutamyltransferase [Saccharopolyspora griseoalba]|uniref:Glutathione hydrolase proenzyme n=1 Tax=Saccharopolyspora griseoalba TaxID=1431848 RepID=A0ABW2LMN3_9PSEU
MARRFRVGVGLLAALGLLGPLAPAASGAEPPAKEPVAVGYGGAVSSVDPDATRIGLDVLRRGGTATDAAVATAAALGVTEPYSAGIGGGGFFVHYDAASGEVETIDGRETAPKAAGEDLLLDENGDPLPFDEAVTSGLGVGVPGTPATWQRALDRWGHKSLADVLEPAEELAREGFVVDQTFHDQTADNAERFADFPATRELFLPGGKPPEVGSVLRNPDLADTYRAMARRGTDEIYRGATAGDIARTVTDPPVDPAAERDVRPGEMTTGDLADYRALDLEPTHVGYRGYDVYGQAPASSGGTTVGEALNILERTDLAAADEAAYLHRYLESSKIAFADRNRWVGDPAFSEVPTAELTGDEFAASRECLIRDDAVLPTPVAAGDPHAPQDCTPRTSGAREPYEGPNTTHLTTADAYGNVVSYTLTIEQTGGSGMVVPGRGFLLNNELTDFSFTPNTPGEPDPNLPGPGKRPRSSMSPTIVLRDGKPFVAVGSPGGSTIITTALQVLTGRVDRGMTLAQAIAEPRASQRNGEETDAEPGFLAQPEADELKRLGHRFGTASEIGAATGVELLPDGRWVAAAEPERRGGGSAGVVVPTP